VDKLIWGCGLFLIVIGGVKLTHILTKKYKINRWVIGFVAPFILIVPSILFENIHPIVWNVLQIVFSLLCIIFFEITRTMLENNRIKGIIKYNNTTKKHI
jgi:hypothetical protein